ncbi:MAG: TIGR03084 family protein [Acidimicrobiia bacterium]|nr:TIGR03084 family protein [Acidimicrobiia bacterium]
MCDDLNAEHAALDRIVSAPGALARPTPAPGWTVADQISHLWFFDQRALMALTDPDAFAADAVSMLAELEATGGTDRSVAEGRVIGGEQLLASWRRDRAALVEHARTVDPKSRVPWYGPAMSGRSFLTARLMETWAHGQDAVDGLGVERPATDRLRHVAHIGVGARPYSYVANGRPVPEAPVRVELAAPSGERWAWGPEDAAGRVTGPALDFCLLVTQRRHRDDVDVRAHGPAADEWLDIAQAFAGPPGPGRRPGQFRL